MTKSYFTLGFLFLIVNLYSQTTYVPDDNFEQSLINLGYDTGALDNYVPTANINKVAYLDVSRKNISDLTGVKNGSTRTTTRVPVNLLSNLDVTQNTELIHIEYENNKLCKLDMIKNVEIDMYNGYSNQFINFLNRN